MPNKLKDIKEIIAEAQSKVLDRVAEVKEKIRPESMGNGPVRRVIGDFQDRGGILAIIRPMGKTSTTRVTPISTPTMPVVRRGMIPGETPLVTVPAIGGRTRIGGEDVTKPLIGGS